MSWESTYSEGTFCRISIQAILHFLVQFEAMSILATFVSLLAVAAAAPAADTSSSFKPLPSSLTNPVNLSSVYIDVIQAQKP